jgi:hypothetical protein
VCAAPARFSQAQWLIRAHQHAVEQHVEDLNRAVEREFRQTGSISISFAAPHPAASSAFASFAATAAAPASSSSSARPSASASVGAGGSDLDRSMRLEHLDGQGNGNGNGKRDLSSDDEQRESAVATEQRRRLQYQPAVSGSVALGRSQPISSASSANKKSAPARATVASVLCSSSSEGEDDAETRTRRQLVEQAHFLHSQRARKREAILSASLGVSGHSRGRSGAARERDAAAQRKQQEDSGKVLESSSDDDDPPLRRDPLAHSTRRPGRSANSVSFAPSRSLSASARSAASTSTPVGRSEKDLAAQVFVNSSDEEEAGRPVAPIDAPIVRAANGRIAGTPSNSAPSLKQPSPLRSACAPWPSASHSAPGRSARRRGRTRGAKLRMAGEARTEGGASHCAVDCACAFVGVCSSWMCDDDARAIETGRKLNCHLMFVGRAQSQRSAESRSSPPRR